ncbi:MAG: DUF262 domain-containing protein [Prevotella sp.]|nr:DUF262 domain-containing protein [Prevotella sp.]
MEEIDNPQYDKDFAPIPIAELLDGQHLFVIPSFQRGYRWEEKQVTDLLEDIKQFADNDSPENDSYFLQPVVVKEISYNGMKAYEVLDGQQRLTTLLLLMKLLIENELSAKNYERFNNNLYRIIYKNRPQLDFDNPNPSKNIDSYYLYEAKSTIEAWFQKNENYSFSKFVDTLLYKEGVNRQVKIIWYAVDKDNEEVDSINIFNRLNKGKISLTSSELIKALFIMDYELGNKDNPLPADQLSMEWNEMERKFEDDKFWYFISDDNAGCQTRIDLLFDFVTHKDNSKDKDYSYREFQKLYDFCRKRARGTITSLEKFSCSWAKDIRSLSDAWTIVRKTFDRMVAWYEDNMYYHYIGYLIAVGFSPLQIFNNLEEAKSKNKNNKYQNPPHEWTDDDTMLALRRMMMERFKDNNVYCSKEDINGFEYSNSDFVRRILLLFNVESCRLGGNVRFAFDKFKKGKWDIEHIDSQNDATLQEFDDRMRWLSSVKFILGLEDTKRSRELAIQAEQLHEEFEQAQRVNKDKYQNFYLLINKHFAVEENEDEATVDLTSKKKDFLGNLTLLDSSTNREYKDAPFAYKRYCIMKYDRAGDRFIPICTRNVFLKYYSNSDKKTSYLDTMRWNEEDRKDYIQAIHKAVDPIFDSVSDTTEQ